MGLSLRACCARAANPSPADPGSTIARLRPAQTIGKAHVPVATCQCGGQFRPWGESTCLRRNLDRLRSGFLRGGVAPRQVERLLLELKTHAAALLDEEIARGQPIEAARALARSRLGSDDEILAKALEQRALMSWGARWPVIVCALLPPVGLLALSVGTVSALVGDCRAWTAWNRDPASWGLGVLAVGSPRNIAHRLAGALWIPGAVHFLLARYTVTRRLGLAWPLVGVLLTSALGRVDHLHRCLAASRCPRTAERGCGTQH